MIVIRITLVLATLLLAACEPAAGAASPEAAALWEAMQVVPACDRLQRSPDIQLHLTRAGQHGAVVLYSTPHCDAEVPLGLRDWGYVLVERRGEAWYAVASSYGAGNPPPEKLIVSAMTSFPGGQNMDIIVYGRALAPNVAAVEATLDTGRTLRDGITAGMFALIAPGTTAVCELRVLDAQGHALRRIDALDPSTAPPMLPEVHQRAQTRCRRE